MSSINGHTATDIRNTSTETGSQTVYDEHQCRGEGYPSREESITILFKGATNYSMSRWGQFTQLPYLLLNSYSQQIT